MTKKSTFSARKFDWRKIASVVRDAPTIPTVILVVFLVFGAFGSFIVPYEPNKTSFADALTPPWGFEGGSSKHILGTDQLGRDVLSRIIIGASISLQVGIITVVVAGLVGSAVACFSGYMGGKWDLILMRLLDMVMSMPFLVVAIALAAILGASKWNLIIILCLVAWAWYARVLRAEVLKIKEVDFIRLAVVAGVSKPRIMLRHIFPNIVNTLVVLATLNLGSVIILEASLSFLGLGVPPPDPTWGGMVSEGRDYINGAWWLCTLPGIAILLVVLSFNLLGDWLRVRLDPKLRQV
ncbi:MAG: ABC transporter permease [Deltaproteobacteria bacterium]|nr:ABC transporter permease [Deltaproteobacteria bacterium]